LQHVFYSDGNKKTISWVIQTNGKSAEQKREHAEIYLDKVTVEQSKYISLHVAMFWAIGVYLVKNEDTIKIMISSKPMYEHLSENKKHSDSFIETRTGFIRQLINQRKLNVMYQLIDTQENIATKLI